MASSEASKLLIIGVGNDDRSDDAVGRVVARRLKRRLPRGARVTEESGEGTSLLDAWKDAEIVILFDAARSGAPPGTVHRIDGLAQRLPKPLFRGSTHAFGVDEAIALGRELKRLPPRLIVYGIEGKNFEEGRGLSPEVEKAAKEVEARTLEEIRAFESFPLP